MKTMERMRQEYKFESMEALEKAIVEQGYSLDDYKQQIRNQYLTSQVMPRSLPENHRDDGRDAEVLRRQSKISIVLPVSAFSEITISH